MRSCCHKLNPFYWTQKTIFISFTLFFSIMIPTYLLGFSAFAAPVLPQNASLRISSIGIFAPVSPHILKNNEFLVPNSRIASYTNGYKIFLYAHNYSSFRNLHKIKVNDQLIYESSEQNSTFIVTRLENQETSQVDMNRLLEKSSQPELIMMTCAGQPTSDNDYSERLIVYAKKLN